MREIEKRKDIILRWYRLYILIWEKKRKNYYRKSSLVSKRHKSEKIRNTKTTERNRKDILLYFNFKYMYMCDCVFCAILQIVLIIFVISSGLVHWFFALQTLICKEKKKKNRNREKEYIFSKNGQNIFTQLHTPWLDVTYLFVAKVKIKPLIIVLTPFLMLFMLKVVTWSFILHIKHR